MRRFVNSLICILSLALQAFGILSLLYVIGVYKLELLSFYDSIRLILRYVVIIASMAAGIMLFNLFASRCKYVPRTILSIGVTVYSTVLTLPLLATFVLCLVMMFGVNLTGFLNDFVAPIATEFEALFKDEIIQYVIYGAGILMSVIFLAVPIAMCAKLNAKPGRYKAKEFIRV